MNLTSGTRYSKECKFGCGKIIEWDTEKQAYIDPATEEKHECSSLPKFHTGRQLYEENKIVDKLCEFIETLNNDCLMTQKIKVERIYL